MMRMDAVVSAIARDAGLDPDRVGQDEINIFGWVNDTRRELYELPGALSALEFVGELVGLAHVTAGTCKATQTNSEITGSSTSWTTAMAGRYMSIATGAWMRISFVSDTTHLTLESGWPGATVTGQTSRIWQKYYPLPPKVAKINKLVDLSAPRDPVTYYDTAEFHQRYGYGDTMGDPKAYTQFGSSERGLEYLGSTVFATLTATANSPIIDFGSTGLVTAMAAGDYVIIGDSTTSTGFYVDKVLTDTKIALNQKMPLGGTSISASAYSKDRLMLQLYPSVDAVSKIFFYEAVKSYSDVVSTADYIERSWYSAIKKGTVAKAMAFVRDPREQQKLGEYEDEKRMLLRNNFKAKNVQPRLKPHITQRYGNSTLSPSDRDE